MEKIMLEAIARRVRALAVPVLLTSLLLAGRAEAGVESDSGAAVVSRVYPIYYMDVREAELTLEEKLGEEISRFGPYRLERMEVPRRADSPNGYLRIFTVPGLHERIEAVLKKYDAPAPTQVFQVFLLEASKQPAGPVELPAAATKAIEDLKGLFPFKGFRVLQSAMVRSSEQGFANLGGEFNLQIAFRSPREAGRPILVERFTLVSSDITKPEQKRNLLNTSFSITRGETVVVGTSKLDGGDQAMVVLLTALE